MSDRPILFSAPMVRALLDGSKTQTRRTIKVRGRRINAGDWITLDQFRRYRFVPYAPGDRLWVREAWSATPTYDDLKPSEMGGEEAIRYEADGAWGRWGWDAVSSLVGRKRPGMFMPRWASRLTLTVTEVRVQRVQDISGADCVAEGCKGFVSHDGQDGETPEEEFRALWDSLNAKRGYGCDANPWVCAISFDVHQCNIDQMEASQ